MADTGSELGGDPETLGDEDLFRELASLYRSQLIEFVGHGTRTTPGRGRQTLWRGSQ